MTENILDEVQIHLIRIFDCVVSRCVSSLISFAGDVFVPIFDAEMANPSLAEYLTTDAVVVQVHAGPRVALLTLAGVDELAGEVCPVADVGRATAPRELALAVAVPTQSPLVASAVEQVAAAAGPRQRVHHAGRTDGVHERCLSAAG